MMVRCHCVFELPLTITHAHTPSLHPTPIPSHPTSPSAGDRLPTMGVAELIARLTDNDFDRVPAAAADLDVATKSGK